MNPYQRFVGELARLMAEGKAMPLGGLPPSPRPPTKDDAPKVLLFSPHPDDEVIIGGLPLRLMREAGMNIVNVAVTQGSSQARQQERLQELAGCCHYIGFGLIQTREGGLEGINLKSRSQNGAHWNNAALPPLRRISRSGDTP